MNTSYLSLLGIVAPVYLVVLVGLGVRRVGWLTEEADESLLRLVVNLLLPCLVLDAILGNPALGRSANILLPPLAGFATVVLGFALSLCAARLFPQVDQVQRRSFAFATGMYNYGYLALPIVAALFNRETLGILFTHNLGVEVAFWTAGVMVLTGSSLRGGWRRAINPPVLAILLALVLNAVHAAVWLPHFLLAGIHSIAGISIPLALILTGATIADWLGTLRTGLRPGLILLSCGLRLGLLPLLMLFLARFLPASQDLRHVMIIQAAMPAAMLPVVIAKHYGGDPGIALQVVLATSVAGLLTIPFWIQFGLHFVGG